MCTSPVSNSLLGQLSDGNQFPCPRSNSSTCSGDYISMHIYCFCSHVVFRTSGHRERFSLRLSPFEPLCFVLDKTRFLDADFAPLLLKHVVKVSKSNFLCRFMLVLCSVFLTLTLTVSISTAPAGSPQRRARRSQMGCGHRVEN